MMMESTNTYKSGQYSEEDFKTFVSKKDLESYSNLILTNAEFKDALFFRSYYSYQVFKIKEEIKEGPFAGIAPDDKLMQQEQGSNFKKTGDLDENRKKYSIYQENLNEIFATSIVISNQETDILKHSMVRNGRSFYVTDTLFNITREEAIRAMDIGIKIGYVNAHEEHHGSWEGYYGYHAVLTKDQLLSTSQSLSIDPVYEMAGCIKSKELKKIINDDYLNINYISAVEKYIINDLKKNRIRPTKPLVNNIFS